MSMCLLKTQLKDHLEVHQYKYSMLDRNQNFICHIKEEALDRTMWRARFGRGFGPVVRQTTK